MLELPYVLYAEATFLSIHARTPGKGD